MTIYPSFLDLLDNEQSYVEKNDFSNEHDNNNSAFPMNPFSCKTDSSDDRPASTLETDFSDDDFVSDQYLNHSCSSLDLDKEVEAITMRAQRLFPDEDKDWTEFGWLLDAKWDETNNMPQKEDEQWDEDDETSSIDASCGTEYSPVLNGNQQQRMDNSMEMEEGKQTTAAGREQQTNMMTFSHVDDNRQQMRESTTAESIAMRTRSHFLLTRGDERHAELKQLKNGLHIDRFFDWLLEKRMKAKMQRRKRSTNKNKLEKRCGNKFSSCRGLSTTTIWENNQNEGNNFWRDGGDERLYCICRQPYNQSRFYVGCDGCDDWFHPECIGTSQKEVCALDVDSYFFCPKCKDQNNNNIGI